MNNLGILSGNVKGDVVVTLQFEPQTLVLLAILVVLIIIIAAVVNRAAKQ